MEFGERCLRWFMQKTMGGQGFNLEEWDVCVCERGLFLYNNFLLASFLSNLKVQDFLTQFHMWTQDILFIKQDYGTSAIFILRIKWALEIAHNIRVVQCNYIWTWFIFQITNSNSNTITTYVQVRVPIMTV